MRFSLYCPWDLTFGVWCWTKLSQLFSVSCLTEPVVFHWERKLRMWDWDWECLVTFDESGSWFTVSSLLSKKFQRIFIQKKTNLKTIKYRVTRHSNEPDKLTVFWRLCNQVIQSFLYCFNWQLNENEII